MTHTAPVANWATDFDVLDPHTFATVLHLGRSASDLPDRPHRPAQDRLVPTRYEDVTAIAHDIEHFSSQKIAVIPGDGTRTPPTSRARPAVRASSHLVGPAAAHVDPPAPAAVVLAQARRGLRAADAGAVPPAARRVRRADRPTRQPTTPSRSPSGSSPTSSASPDLSDTFTGWVRDVLEFADDAERAERGCWPATTCGTGSTSDGKTRATTF